MLSIKVHYVKLTHKFPVSAPAGRKKGLMNLSIIHLFQTLKRLLEQLHHHVTRERIPHEHGVATIIGNTLIFNNH